MTTTTTTLTASSSLVSTRVQQQQRKRKNSSRNNNNKNVAIKIKALGGFGPEIKPEEIRRIQEERRKKIERAKRDAEARKKSKNAPKAKDDEKPPKKFFGLFWEERERVLFCARVYVSSFRAKVYVICFFFPKKHPCPSPSVCLSVSLSKKGCLSSLSPASLGKWTY